MSPSSPHLPQQVARLLERPWVTSGVNRCSAVIQHRSFHHLLPILAFLLFMGAFFGYNEWQYRKDPQGNTAKFSFTRSFLKGRYDQGIYRGIGVTCYRQGKRSGWYPGAAIAGGLLWRAAGRPDEGQPGLPLFYLSYFVPSILYGFIFIYFFYRYAFLNWGSGPAIVSLCSLLCFPPSFYFLTAFPYTMALACMTAYLVVYESRSRTRYLWLGLLGFTCSITYPSSALFALVPTVRELVLQWRKKRFRLRPYLAYGIPFVLGPLAFFTYLYAVTGDFLGYVNHQGSHYDRVFGSPLSVVLEWFQAHPLVYPENLTAVLVLLYLALYANSRIGPAMWMYILAILIFSPFTGSFQCVYRHYLLAFPLHYLCGVSRKPLWVKISFMAVLAYINVKYFFWLYLDFILT